MKALLNETELLILRAADGLLAELGEKTLERVYEGVMRPVDVMQLGKLRGYVSATRELLSTTLTWHQVLTDEPAVPASGASSSSAELREAAAQVLELVETPAEEA